MAYQSAANIVTRGILWSAFLPVHAPTARLRFTFPRQQLQAVRIVQTSFAGDTWSIHEFRAIDGARELPGDARWRATADPFPWGIEKAFDGNPVTFWVCGETLRPGQFVQVDFPAPVTADAVLLEAAPNQPGLRLKLEGRNAADQWKPLAAAPEVSEVAGGDYRQAASVELRKRGIDYLLLFDDEFGADEFRAHTDAWGMRLAGEYRGARLYQLP